jgi:type IV secretion system protein VirB6
MNWAVFQQLSGLIEPPVISAAEGVMRTLISAVAGPLGAALAIYVALTGYQMFTGHMAEPLRDTWPRIAKGAFVVALLSAGNYNTYVSNLFLTGIPNDISNALGGGALNAGIFDHIWNIAFKGGLEVWKNTSFYDLGLEILIILYWAAAAIACVLGFLVWQSAQILLALFVAVGPLIVGMFLFNATRAVFERWIGALLSMIFLQVMVIILLVVLTRAENAVLGGLTGAGGNVIAQIQGIFAPIILFVLAALLIWQMPSAATALAAGMHFHAYALHRATLGKAADAVSAVASRGSQTIGQGARSGVNALTGRSLSVSGGSPP